MSVDPRLESPDLVRIRIWRSCFIQGDSISYYSPVYVGLYLQLCCCCSRSEGCVGHVSLEIQGQYISLWPAISNQEVRMQRPALTRAGFIATLEQDIRSEGRYPDVEIDLHTLDVDTIRQSFHAFDAGDKRYVIVGRDRIAGCWTANSCSGLVYDLLVAGGIKRLVPGKSIFRDHILTTPLNILELVRMAQEKEKQTQ